jgi:hypothetical protein
MPRSDDHGSEYEVGFRKPPKRTQFRKGVSGNPGGRPAGRPNLKTVLKRILEEKVVINENGSRRTVTKFEAALKHLVNKAASGDLRALQQLTPLANSVEQAVDVPTKKLSEADAKVFQNFVKRIQGFNAGGNDDNS